MVDSSAHLSQTRRLPLRSVFIGSVESSRAALAALQSHPETVDVVGIFGLAESASRNVSGFARLDDLAARTGTPYQDFVTINDAHVVTAIRDMQPDLVWVVGLSQVIGADLIAIPTIGCVGFHPTRLPVGRGRGPVAWSILADVPAAATLFLIDDGVDSGPIVAQVPVAVDSDAGAGDVLDAIYRVIPDAVDAACKQLAEPGWSPGPQDHVHATYLGVRRDVDGVIDWHSSTDAVQRLIRAAAPPHPGAWTFIGRERIRVLGCRAATERWYGVPGRILQIGASGEMLVATSDGALWLTEYETPSTRTLRVGVKLGANPQAEIFSLRQRIVELEAKIEELISARSSAGKAPGAGE